MAVDRLIWRNLLDFGVLVVFGLTLLAINLWVEPYHRGYFEDDLSIRLPYKQQQISEGLCAGLGFALNVITIAAVELIRNRKGKGVGEKFFCGSLISGWVWESYRGIAVFTFGAACQQLATTTAKYVIGRLRPNFYDVCRPVPLNSPINALGYIVEFSCNGTNDASRLTNIRLSFPSAHASFAMYSAVFFIMYIQIKAKWRGSKLLRHAAQFAVLMGAWYIGLSRVVDHMHHWGDVTVGFIVGAAFAVVTFVYVLKPKKYGLPDSWKDNVAESELPRPVLAR